MRIAVISSTVFAVPLKGYGGLELVALQCAEGLAKLGHDVTFYAPDGSQCQHSKVRHFGPPGRIDERTAYTGYWQELLNYDVIVDHSWGKFSYILKIEGKLKAPVLGVCHAPINTMFGSPPPIEKSCIVTISIDQKNHYEALFEKEARVCYNGIDHSYYKPIEGVKRTDRFLFLARFSHIKGALLAIEACKNAGAKLDLIGDTSITNEPDYFNQCAALCDGDQIRMVGPASRGECVHWYSQAFAFLHPTKFFREPFGLAPIEAQACGLPVIGWNRGSLSEIIIQGRTGWLVNSVEQLTKQIKYVLEMGITDERREECIGWSRQAFSLEKNALRYQELCKEALEGGW